LGIAQKCAIRRVLKQEPHDFFHISSQQIPPNGVLARLGRIIFHMPLHVGNGVADEVGSVNKPATARVNS
jgi:hypothetical protein